MAAGNWHCPRRIAMVAAAMDELRALLAPAATAMAACATQTPGLLIGAALAVALAVVLITKLLEQRVPSITVPPMSGVQNGERGRFGCWGPGRAWRGVQATLGCLQHAMAARGGRAVPAGSATVCRQRRRVAHPPGGWQQTGKVLCLHC